MKKIILSLSICGLIFSGYISSLKIFSHTCAFNETCPYFLGYPACYFGFIMFLLITIFAVLRFFRIMSDKRSLLATLLISILGILFAGYFTLGELPTLFAQGLSAYFFGLPTCALGLVFYTLIFGFSIKGIAKIK